MLMCTVSPIFYFNPRPPWGGRRKENGIETMTPEISIHALRGEGDICAFKLFHFFASFQSTPSVGRATSDFYEYFK